MSAGELKVDFRRTKWRFVYLALSIEYGLAHLKMLSVCGLWTAVEDLICISFYRAVSKNLPKVWRIFSKRQVNFAPCLPSL